MREIRVHLDDIVRQALSQHFVYSIAACRSITALVLAAQQVDSGIVLLQASNFVGRAVRRTVIHKENRLRSH